MTPLETYTALFSLRNFGSFEEVAEAGAFLVWPVSGRSLALYEQHMKPVADQCIGFVDQTKHIQKEVVGKPIFSPSDRVLEKSDAVVIAEPAYFREILESVHLINKNLDVIIPLADRDFFRIRNVGCFLNLGSHSVCMEGFISGTDDIRSKVASAEQFAGFLSDPLQTAFLSETTRQRLAESYLHYLFDGIPVTTIDSDGKPCILFSAGPTCWNFVRTSIALKNHGYKTFFLTESPVNFDEKSVFFDGAYLEPNLFRFFLLLVTARVSVVHMRGWMQSYCFPAMVSCAALSPVVVECLDIPEFYGSREEYSDLFGEDCAHDDFEGFRVLFQNADAVLLNHRESEIDQLRLKYRRTDRVLEFNSYCSDAFLAEKKQADADQPIHIAYAGSVSPSCNPKEFFGATQLLPFIKTVTAQNIRFSALMNPAQKKDRLYWDYSYEEKHNPLFELKRGLPPLEAAALLSAADFGLMAFDYSCVKIKKGTLAGGLPTKFTLYLEAGLPIIVSEELECLADIVRKNHIGVVVKQSQLKSLPSVLLDCDYPLLLEHVCEFRQMFNFRKQTDRLKWIYDSVQSNSKGNNDIENRFPVHV